MYFTIPYHEFIHILGPPTMYPGRLLMAGIEDILEEQGQHPTAT